jgi:NADPH2:quinone reductase
MQAVTFDRFGGPEVLCVRDIPAPARPEAGEVIVRVAAATVNPTDLLMRSGEQAASMAQLKPPFIAGMEFSGHVHKIGDPFSRLKLGQAVMGTVRPRRPQGGAQAEYVRVPAASVVALAPHLDLVAAATVPMNGLTALVGLRLLGLRPGASLLVTGATGAVGGYAVQLAKRAGIHVVADAKESDHPLLRERGVNNLVPRGEQMLGAVRDLFPDGVDALLDGALLADEAAPAVRTGGAVISLRRSSLPKDPRVRAVHVGVTEHMEETESLALLADLLRTGVLTPRVAARLPAEKAMEAHQLVERGGLRGRVVLTF